MPKRNKSPGTGKKAKAGKAKAGKPVPQLVTVDTADILQVDGVAWSAAWSAGAINAAARNIASNGPDWARFPGAPEGAKRGRKAFIYGVWQLFFQSQISLEGFKDLVRELHTRRLLTLSRFDLVEARGTPEGYEITRLSTTPAWKGRPSETAQWTFIDARGSNEADE